MTDTATKYTPGPWRAGSSSDGWCVCPEWDWPTHRGKGHVIVFGIECEANALLLAAAPELGEILRAMVDECSINGSPSLGLVDRANLALQKAGLLP